MRRCTLALIPLLAAAAAVSAAPPATRPVPAPARRPAAAAKPGAKAPRTLPAAVPKIVRLPSRGGIAPSRLKPPAVPAKASSVLPTPQAIPVTTLLTTSSPYDPRLDAKPDLVVLDRSADVPEEVDRGLQSWRSAGYPVHRLFSFGQDAGSLYTTGKADGTPHTAEVDLDAADKPIKVGDRPSMVPGAGWMVYMKEQIRRAIDAGAEGVWPAGAGLDVRGGYSPAFKSAWQDLYKTGWKPPLESPTTFFQASRLRADLNLRAMDELLRYTREYSQLKGRAVKFLVPLESLPAAAEGGLVFPLAAVSRLPVDGIVARVRPPWARTGRSGGAGPRADLPLVEDAWLQLSYFVNLLDGVPDKQLYIAPEPADAGVTPAQQERWWKAVTSAALLISDARAYGIQSYPERAVASAGGAPLTPLVGLTAAAFAEQNTQATVELGSAPQRIGVLALDTMSWQRGGPRGSTLASFYGQALPLLRRGVPVEIVPGERVADVAFLNRFKVLLLSYDMQKPITIEVNQSLAEWVKAGGTLVLLGGEDSYNRIGEWWSLGGYAGPTDHLLRECGVQADVALRTVRDTSTQFSEVIRSAPGGATPGSKKSYHLALAPYAGASKPVYLRFDALNPEGPIEAALGRVRVLDGTRVRADFVAGAPAERAFLAEEGASRAAAGGRVIRGEASFIYRFLRLNQESSVDLELSDGIRVSLAVGIEPAATLQPLPSTPAELRYTLRVPASFPVVSYPLAGAEPLLSLTGGPAIAAEAAPAWISPAGNGTVLYCGVPAAFGLEAGGGDLIRGLVRLACLKAALPYQEVPLVAHRGAYVIAYSLGRAMDLKGRYIDLFNPDLPLVENPRLSYLDPHLFKEVKGLGRIPGLLHATHRARVVEATVARLRLLLEGPQGAPGTARIYAAGMSLERLEATDENGKSVPVEVRLEGTTLRVRYTQSPSGVNLVLRWIRPEARLTK